MIEEIYYSTEIAEAWFRIFFEIHKYEIILKNKMKISYSIKKKIILIYYKYGKKLKK